MELAASRPVTAAQESFLPRVFSWMFIGLAITGAVAAVGSSSEAFTEAVTSNPGVFIAIIIGQLILVIVLVAAIRKISPTVAITLFFLYAALNGVIFAFIFELYTEQSVWTAFFITGAMFGAMAGVGFVTKRDLSKLGPILFMALIGLIIASIVNLFVGGNTLYWITTYAGVLIFSALAAYDMNKLKKIRDQGFADETQQKRSAIIGALSLYLDFINLFLMLLRLFGQNRG